MIIFFFSAKKSVAQSSPEILQSVCPPIKTSEDSPAPVRPPPAQEAALSADDLSTHGGLQLSTSGSSRPEEAFKAALDARIAAAKATCGSELANFLVVTSRRICCLDWIKSPVEVCLDLLSQESLPYPPPLPPMLPPRIIGLRL